MVACCVRRGDQRCFVFVFFNSTGSRPTPSRKTLQTAEQSETKKVNEACLHPLIGSWTFVRFVRVWKKVFLYPELSKLFHRRSLIGHCGAKCSHQTHTLPYRQSVIKMAPRTEIPVTEIRLKSAFQNIRTNTFSFYYRLYLLLSYKGSFWCLLLSLSPFLFGHSPLFFMLFP